MGYDLEKFGDSILEIKGCWIGDLDDDRSIQKSRKVIHQSYSLLLKAIIGKPLTPPYNPTFYLIPKCTYKI